MSDGDEGAMGVHYGNISFVDGTVDQLHAEVLIYEPGTNGELSPVSRNAHKAPVDDAPKRASFS